MERGFVIHKGCFDPTESLSVIVPCHNECQTVATILRSVRSALPGAEIVFVDDGSDDASLDIVATLQEDLQIRVIPLAGNRGKGAAVRAGLDAVTRRWVVIQDADCEYDPWDLIQMLAQARSSLNDPVTLNDLETLNERVTLNERASAEPVKVIYGSRYLGAGRAAGGSYANYIGVKLLAILQWLLYGRWLTDPHTCYKMLPTGVMRSLELSSDGFELCAEMNSKLLARGIEIEEVPVGYRPRRAADGKEIRFHDFLKAAWTYTSYRFGGSIPRDRRRTGGEIRWLYVATRMVTGVILMVAGASKVSPWTSLALTSWLVLPAPLVFGWGLYELSIGWGSISLIPHRGLHRLLMVTFSLFFIVLLLQWWDGEASCQCMGTGSMPIAWMGWVDLCILAGLVWFRSDWISSHFDRCNLLTDQISNLRIVVPLFLIGGILWFGSFESAYGYVSGQRVVADTTTKFAGVVQEGEFVDVVYMLQNTSTQPVRAIGATGTCRCIGILDLPVTIDPGDSCPIRLRLYGQSVDRMQRESAMLMFDDSALNLTLNATVLVRPNHE